MDHLKAVIRDIPDFPKPGILFRDVTTLLNDGAAFGEVTDSLAARYRGKGITQIVGIESRGFIFGAALAHALRCGLTVVRKPGKLPRATHAVTYSLEYGDDQLEIHRDALSDNDHVVILDDLLATGGTANAARSLVRLCGANLYEMAFLVELGDLGGRSRLAGDHVHALLTY